MNAGWKKIVLIHFLEVVCRDSSPLPHSNSSCVSKSVVSSIAALCCRHICACVHVVTQVSHLSPLSFAHMCMCAGLTTWGLDKWCGCSPWEETDFPVGVGLCGVSPVPVSRSTGIVPVLVSLGQLLCCRSRPSGSYNLSAPLPRSSCGVHVRCGARECFPCVRGNTGVRFQPVPWGSSRTPLSVP